MRRMLLGFGIAAAVVGGLDRAGGVASAQYPGETRVFETVSPGYNTVTYGERFKIRSGPYKTVIKERPFAYIDRTPPVVRETRYYQPAPLVERTVVQPAPIVEDVVIQPPPIVQRRVVQPAPIYQERVYRPEPVIQTRYYSPYP